MKLKTSVMLILLIGICIQATLIFVLEYFSILSVDSQNLVIFPIFLLISFISLGVVYILLQLKVLDPISQSVDHFTNLRNSIDIETLTSRYRIIEIRQLIVIYNQFIEQIETARLSSQKKSEGSIVQHVDEIERLKKEIQKRRHTEKDLITAKSIAEKANEAKGIFLSNISQEVKTPINGIIGMTNLLMEDELNATQNEYTHKILTSSEHLLSVVNDILDFSRIEAKQLDLDHIGFDMRLLLEEVADTIAFRAYEKGLDFACIIHHEVPSFLCGDPGRIKQILVNISANAVKFTSKGEVFIRTIIVDQTDTLVTLRFDISDTGIGIPKERFEDIFQSYLQLEETPMQHQGGIGLGLAISKELVALMDGEIGVSSEVGKGSDFWVIIQIAKRKATHKERLLVSKNITDQRILIVDPSQTNTMVLTEQLQRLGCPFETAATGDEALKKIDIALMEKNPFKVALIEKQMPDMKGETLGKMIRKTPKYKDTQLVMLTVLGQRGDASKMEKIGFAAYLTKPVKHTQLSECIARVLIKAETATEDEEHTIITRYSLEEEKKSEKKILVVEDNIVNQMIALKVIQNLGFQADAVDNGQKAVEALAQTPYHLVLMDIQMPVMNGFEATKAIRSPESNLLNPLVPIIAMTANDDQEDQDKCYAVGMNDYLSKPLKAHTLSETIEKYLGEKKLGGWS